MSLSQKFIRKCVNMTSWPPLCPNVCRQLTSVRQQTPYNRQQLTGVHCFYLLLLLPLHTCNKRGPPRRSRDTINSRIAARAATTEVHRAMVETAAMTGPSRVSSRSDCWLPCAVLVAAEIATQGWHAAKEVTATALSWPWHPWKQIPLFKRIVVY